MKKGCYDVFGMEKTKIQESVQYVTTKQILYSRRGSLIFRSSWACGARLGLVLLSNSVSVFDSCTPPC